MSEQTGATAEQIEVAAERWYGAANPSASPPWRDLADDARAEWIALMHRVMRAAVPPGYRIVPADAVCIDRATADTAAEACAITATRIDNLIRLGQDQDGDTEAAERYRAAAAVLRGGGGG